MLGHGVAVLVFCPSNNHQFSPFNAQVRAALAGRAPKVHLIPLLPPHQAFTECLSIFVMSVIGLFWPQEELEKS